MATGRGRLTTDSRVLDDARYSFRTRFGDEAGTNPEELIAAAHAGCFSMALAFYLEKAGMSPELIQTTAELTLQPNEDGPTIEGIHLRATARVPDAHTEEFRRVAEQAKDGCLVSRLLNTKITLEAVLEQPNPALRQ